MRNWLLLFVCVFALGFTTAYPATSFAKKEQSQSSYPGSFADLVDDLLPAVVNISSTQKPESVQDFPDMPHFPPGSPFEDFFEDFMDRRGRGSPAIPPASLGSGFIIDAENGYVITNNHVVNDADEVRVTFHDDTTVEAEVLGRDEKTDIAVLQVKTDYKMTAVKFGDSKDLRVGDWVVAIGNPFGLGGTVTAGIVSARQRNINAGPYDDFIQTDASINRGNSGGPMFNTDGQVIGINTAIFSPSGGSVGIGFAIPSNLAKPVINQLIEYGRTRRGWLGVRIQTVTDEIAESLGLDKAQGALVASVTETSPAEKAGVETGDIILNFDGKPIEEMRDLPRLVAETKIDRVVSVDVWRDGKKRSVKVKIAELEEAEENGLLSAEASSSSPSSKNTVTIESVGLTLAELSKALRSEYGIGNDVEGIVVVEVASSSEAAEKGLAAGDVIVEINQQSVDDPKEASKIMNKARKGGRNSVLLLVNRDGDVRFVALRLEEE